MSTDHATPAQTRGIARLHRGQLGHPYSFGVPGDVGLYCLECQKPWPCRTMRVLGAKPLPHNARSTEKP